MILVCETVEEFNHWITKMMILVGSLTLIVAIIWLYVMFNILNIW